MERLEAHLSYRLDHSRGLHTRSERSRRGACCLQERFEMLLNFASAKFHNMLWVVALQALGLGDLISQGTMLDAERSKGLNSAEVAKQNTKASFVC